MNTYQGHHDAKGLRFGIVVSTFNQFITDSLLAAAVEVLEKAGADPSAITVARVPGAFEIPFMAKRMAQSNAFDAVLCLGAVIRGETSHFEYISREASRGVAQAGWESTVPVIFGVLTTDTVDHALARSQPGERNKGGEAARAAIEMATVLRAFEAGLTRRARSRASRGGRPRKATRR